VTEHLAADLPTNTPTTLRAVTLAWVSVVITEPHHLACPPKLWIRRRPCLWMPVFYCKSRTNREMKTFRYTRNKNPSSVIRSRRRKWIRCPWLVSVWLGLTTLFQQVSLWRVRQVSTLWTLRETPWQPEWCPPALTEDVNNSQILCKSLWILLKVRPSSVKFANTEMLTWLPSKLIPAKSKSTDSGKYFLNNLTLYSLCKKHHLENVTHKILNEIKYLYSNPINVSPFSMKITLFLYRLSPLWTSTAEASSP
jgi:hypothetical protein